MKDEKPLILNVDDYEAGRYATTRILTRAGFSVIEAESGLEALDKVSRERPDLVILDINLPDIDGFEVCRRIKEGADSALTAPPVLHLSSTFTDTPAKVKGLEGGADGYLTQPVDPMVLVATVKSLLRLKKIEKKAVAMASQWNMTFDAIQDPICLLDSGGRIMRFNEAFHRLSGKGQDEIAGHFCFEIIHGTATFIENCPLVRAMASGQRESLVATLNSRSFFISVDPVFDAAGESVSFVHIMNDITDRMAVETALDHSTLELLQANQQLMVAEKSLSIQNRIAKMFLTIADNEIYGEVLKVILEVMESPYGVYGYIDDNGSLVVPSMTRHVWDKCDVPDKNIVFPHDKWGHSSWVRAIVEKKSNFTNQPSAGLPPGHLPIDRHISVPIIHQDTVTGLIQVANKAGEYTASDVELLELIADSVAAVMAARIRRDASERERDRLLSAIEQAGEMIVITDVKGIIKYVNPAFSRITGYPEDEARGRSMNILKSGEQDRKFYRRLWTTISRGEKFQARMVNRRKDGSLFTQETTINPVCDAAGTIVNYVAVNRDITEQLLLESRYQHAQKLEAIGTLAGGIAHDFNNILAAILGYTELAREEVGAGSGAAEDLEQVAIAAERAVDLVKQILTISRQREQKRQPVKVQYIIKEALKLLRPTISSLIEIQSEIDPDCPAILADPTEIHQVILNLCTNASHAMLEMDRDRHALKIELEPVELDAAECLKTGENISPGRFVRLRVSDTGTGIDEKTMARIFDPYFTTKKQDHGTGLGLATVHSIVTREKGAITVDSETGKGSCFTVYLPVLIGEVPMREQKVAVQGLRGGTERVMVVDDEDAIAELLKKTLVKFGYQVDIYSSAEDAIKAFSAQPTRFDLVITDMNMPRGMGTDLARALLEKRPDLPVILCTGYSEKVDSDKARAIGIREFLYKPVNGDVLVRLVRSVLDANTADGLENE